MIEDDAYAKRLIGAVAERAGFSVSEVESGEEAERAADRLPFDIIIVDLKLPDTEGLELIGRLHAKPHLVGVPFLVCTGNVSVENVVEAKRRGALEFIRKPIEPFELQKRLENIMDGIAELWVGKVSAGLRTASHFRQEADAVKLARTHVATAVELLDNADVKDEAALVEAMAQLGQVVPKIRSPRLLRLVTEFGPDLPETQLREPLHIALRVALVSLEQRTAS
ncbi:MAG: response regulator [bacterium]